MRYAIAYAVVLWLLTLLSAGVANAVPPALHYPELDSLVTRIAKHPVTVRCPTAQEESDDATLTDWGAWGYVELEWFGGHWRPFDYAVVRGFVCDEALSIARGLPSPSQDEWVQALAVLVLTHEAYHMAPYKNWRNEAVTECRAIKFFERSVVLLGGTPVLARSLLGEAFAIHQWGLADGYQLKTCRLPIPELPLTRKWRI